jgi:glycosyltransferase involved in cell wall biosynthesis
MELLGNPVDALTDEPIEPQSGDVMFGLDISGEKLIQAEKVGLFEGYRSRGVSVQFMVHDLLPIRMPEYFPPGADENHTKWLRSVSAFDGAICVTKTVADDLAAWQTEFGINLQKKRPYRIAWSHHGADVANSAPSKGLPKNAQNVLNQLISCPSFLMVGTIEPRKGYLQTINAFSKLWEEAVDINLVIVGREGWGDLPEAMRRDIPQTVERLRSHPKLNKRLFWLEGISDEYLEKVYAACTCLLAASYGEGFGLPLIEAAQHKLPIIARDIPVFHEVAGDHAYYFDANEPQYLADSIRNWLGLYESNQHPRSDNMRWLTWKESALHLAAALINGH